MSTKYKRSKDVPDAVLVERLKQLAHCVCKPGNERDRELTMRIPAEVDRDADLVLAEAARRLAAFSQSSDLKSSSELD